MLSEASHLRKVHIRGKQEHNKISSQADVVSGNWFID